MAVETSVLSVKVDSSGMVAGVSAGNAALDKMSAAAARSAAATNALSNAFTGQNVAANKLQRTLAEQLREQTGLARAYAQGGAAVERYNLQLKIEAALAEAGVAANTMRGRAIAAQVTQLEALIAANQAAAASQRAADSATASAGGGLQGLAMKALGAAAAIAFLKGAVTDLMHAAMEAEDAERRLASAVARKGEAFKASTADLVSMATKLEAVTAFEDDAIQKAQAILLRFDEINASNLESVTRATLDFAEATGQDAASAATALGKALLVPGEAMRALKEVGITLTQSQQDMVDAWNESGEGAKSVALLVGMMNDKIGGEAEAAARTGAGGVKQFTAALGNLKELLGAALIPDLTFFTNTLRGVTFALSAAAKGDSPAESIALYVGALRQYSVESKTAEQLATSLKLIGDNGRHARDSGPWVPPKSKEELKAAADAAKEYAAKLQEVVDKADPFGKKQRDMARDVALLKEAFKALHVPLADQPRMMAQLTGDWSAYKDAIEPVTLELLDVTSALEEWQKANAGGTKGKPGKDTNVGKLTIDRIEIPPTAYEAANAQLSANLGQGITGAFGVGIAAFLSGSKDAVEQFGDALKNVMINAAAEYLSQILTMLAKELVVRLANVAKEAAARKAANAGSSATGGGGGWMSSLSSLFGGGGGAGATGMSSGMVALGAWVAIAAAAVAILKHQSDRSDAVRYNTSVNYNTHDSGVGTTYVGGKLMETGNKVAEAFRQIVEQVQSATGALLEGAHRAAISIRNDKKGFQAIVDGIIVGTFKTVDEAIIAAVKKLFSAENLKNQIDPIVQQVINNFDTKKGGQAFSEAINAVTKIMNSLSGMTDIEIALRDLPAQTSQLASKLHEMGVAMSDAESVAERWRIQQFASLRDQITGHQQTEAEQRAEKERQAAMFNAELALTKANMALRKSDIESQLETLKARIDVTNVKYELDKWQIEREREFAQQGAEIAQAELDVRAAAGQASIALLQAQLEAINQSLAALDAIKPISMGEIRLPGRGGGGGRSAGPSEREQRAQAFQDFMDQQMADSMGDLERRLYELNEAFREQERAARELGQVEELEAARVAAIARMRQEFLDQYNDADLSDYQRSLRELNEAFREQALLNPDLVGGEQALEEARRRAMARLREDLLNSFGSPMESVRDNLSDMIKRFQDLADANAELAQQLKNGTIKVEEYDAAMEHAALVQQEFNDQMAMNLLGMASYFTDALGDADASADVRARLAEFEYNLKLAEFELTLQTAYAQHWINQELYEYLLDILDKAKENPPDFTLPRGGGLHDGGGSQQDDGLQDALNNLLRALDRLRNVLQTYTDFLRDLQTSEASPYTIEQQYNTAQAEYLRLLALAQAGDINAMEALPQAAQTYLELAGQMFGTASAGYAEIFAGVNADMTAIMGDIQSILDMVPSQFAPMEERLDTIAEIMANMYLLQLNWDMGGTGGGGGGGGWVPPGPNENPHTLQEFFDAFGLDWDQLSGGELLNINEMMRSIVEDSNVSAQEMTSFVSAIEAMLGMTPGSMTQAQINALRTWLYYQVGSSAGSTGSAGDPNQQRVAQQAAQAQLQTNKHLELIASLTAKALREASNDRVKKPTLSNAAGYVGRRSTNARGS